MKFKYSFIFFLILFLSGCEIFNSSNDIETTTTTTTPLPPSLWGDMDTLDFDSEYVEEFDFENRDSNRLFNEEIFERYGNAIFKIVTDRGQGTGFFITSSGIAITNHHVMEGANRATAILLDDTELDITGFYYSSFLNNDLAIIQVDRINGDFEYLHLGDSENIRIGENIVALGHPDTGPSPIGEPLTVTTGNISTVLKGRPVKINIYTVEGLIQFTAAIYTGSSGGPLLNIYGEVIGINSFGRSDRGSVHWAVPINRVPSINSILSMELLPLPFPWVVQEMVDIQEPILDTELFGKWTWGSNTMVFYDDGTGYADWLEVYGYEDFVWSARNNVLKMSFVNGNLGFKYNIVENNNTLSMVGEMGNVFHNKVFEYNRYDLYENDENIDDENDENIEDNNIYENEEIDDYEDYLKGNDVFEEVEEEEIEVVVEQEEEEEEEEEVVVEQEEEQQKGNLDEDEELD